METYLTSGSAAILDRQKQRLTPATLAAIGPIQRLQHGRFLLAR